MHKLWFTGAGVLLIGVISLSTIACGEKKVKFKTDMDKASYSIGVQIGTNFKQGKLDKIDGGINLELVARAMKDVLEDKTIALSDSQMMEVMQAFQTSYQAKMQEMMAAEIKANGERASAFLAENATKPGIVTLEDSLQYQILTEGTGPKPKETDIVQVHYLGTNLDGKEFDSSYRRNEPAEMSVMGVIQGWQKIIPMMSVGSKWKVFIPPALAYGEQAAGPDIPANSLLIFEIELLSIVNQGQ